jgi:hypothetical protein
LLGGTQSCRGNLGPRSLVGGVVSGKLFRRGFGAVLALGITSSTMASGTVADQPLSPHSASRSAGQAPPKGWLTHTDNERGLTFFYPPDWYIARTSLTPALTNPREIVSLGTYPQLDPSDHNCAQVPVNALERLGSGDAFISLQERRPALLDRSIPPRPRRFGSGTGVDGDHTDVTACLSVQPPASLRLIHFAAQQREFYVIVAVGTDASAQRRANTYRILDTIGVAKTRPRSADPSDCPAFAKRTVTVPDVIGLTLATAIRTVERAGLQVVGYGTAPGSPTGKSARVVAQEPGSGSQVPKGACIGFRTQAPNK